LSAVHIEFLPEVKKYMDLQCNGDTKLYTEFPHIKYIDKYLKDLYPKNVLDIGSGIGRASMFFFKRYGWNNTIFNLLDGHTGNIQFSGIRKRKGEFYNSFEVTDIFCKSNGLSNIQIYDAASDAWKSDLKDVDFAYSFFSIGYHWPLDFYLKDIYPTLSENALLIFGIRGIEQKEWICKQLEAMDKNQYDVLELVQVLDIMLESVLILKKK